MATKPKNAVVQKAKVDLPATVQAAMANDITSFQNRLAAPTGNRIAVTQDRKFRAPNGDKFDRVSGIIVDFIAKKAWYPNPYDKDNIVPPHCFGLDFVAHSALEPSENSPERQCETCATCPKNAFGSAENGKGKACKDSYVLALLGPDAEEGSPLMTLEISATGIKPFEKYVRDLARETGKAPYAFVTEFFMDDSVDYASVRCGFPLEASPELIMMALSRREEAATLLSTEPDVSGFEEKMASLKPQKKAPAKAARR